MIGRRSLVLAAAAAPVPPAAAASREAPAPGLELVFESLIRLGEAQMPAPAPLGGRMAIPLLGGTFVGPRLRGVISPGRADHLIRGDHMDEAHAVFDLRTDDGAVIGYSDQGLRDTSEPAPRVFTSVRLTAPEAGPHAWLNRRVFVATVLPQSTADGFVVKSRVYALRWETG